MARNISSNSQPKRGAKGAGLIEYALILVLVVVGSIVILSFVGLGVQRLYGLTAGITKTQKIADGAEYINITGASCYVIAVGSSYYGGFFAATGYTGYFLRVDTNLPVAQLYSAGTQLSSMMSLFEAQTTYANPPTDLNNHYTFRGDIANYPDASKCPPSAVVQSLKGAIAIRPVDVIPQ